jgi:putative MATE family efflux protein
MTDADQPERPMPVRSSASAGAPPPNRSSPGLRRSALTAGPVRSTLLILALPVFGEQMLNTFVGLFDTFLAGRLSTSATAAVGFAAYVSWLVYMLVNLVGAGTTALVSRAEGGDDHEQANHYANQSLALALIVGIGIGGMVFAAAPWFARMQGMVGETYDIIVRYLRIDSIGLVFTSVTLVGAASLRGVGNTRTPMAIFAVVSVANAIASPMLVFGYGPVPEIGVNGIVIGTLIARVSGAVLILVMLARRRCGVELDAGSLWIRRASARRILHIGGPAGFDGAIMWTGHFLLLTVIGHLTADAVLQSAYYAAHIVAVRVEALTYLPAVAWGVASATMIGQSLGAGDPTRAKRVGHEAVLQCGLLSVGIALLFFFGAGAIYRLMHIDPKVHEVGVGPFRVIALMQPLLVLSIVYVHALRGAGDTRYPLLITFVGSILLRVPLGYLFGIVLDGGLIGAWIGMFADMFWRAAAATVRYARGKWLETRV